MTEAFSYYLGAFRLSWKPGINLAKWSFYKPHSGKKPWLPTHKKFVRLANQNLGEIDPEKWVVFMFYDHPPLGERVQMASQIK
jgi:Zn-dependent protease with chaperone function